MGLILKRAKENNFNRYYFRVLLPGGDFTNEYFYVANLFYTWSLKVKVYAVNVMHTLIYFC